MYVLCIVAGVDYILKDAVSEISPPPHVLSELQIGAKNVARELWVEIHHL